MIRKHWCLAAALTAMLGCTESANVPTPDTTKPVSTAPAKPPVADAPKVAEEKAPAAVALADDEIAKIKTLPEADREAATAQKVCPISGEHLGSMGTPKKVSAEGKSLFLCCDGCKKDFEADPKAALAKLGK